MIYIGIALAIGISALGATYGESLIGKTAIDNLARQPEIEGKIRILMLLAMAFIETAVLFGLVVAILLYTKI